MNKIELPFRAFVYMCRLMRTQELRGQHIYPFHIYNGHVIITNGHYAIVWKCNEKRLDSEFFAEVSLPKDFVFKVANLDISAVMPDQHVRMEIHSNMLTCEVELPQAIPGYAGKSFPFAFVETVLSQGLFERLLAVTERAWYEGNKVGGFLFPSDFVSVASDIFGDKPLSFLTRSPVSGKLCLAPFVAQFYVAAQWEEWDFIVLPYEVPDDMMKAWEAQLITLSPDYPLPSWVPMEER